MTKTITNTAVRLAMAVTLFTLAVYVSPKSASGAGAATTSSAEKGANPGKSSFEMWTVGTAAIGAPLSFMAAPPPPTIINCFPSCIDNDGRMLTVAGTNVSSFVGGKVSVGLQLPNTPGVDLQVSIFDGDTTGTWDRGGVPYVLHYALYADVNADGVPDPGPELITEWFSNDANGDTTTGDNLANNAWTTLSFTNEAVALTPSNNYVYVLEVQLLNPTSAAGAISSFKVGSNATLTLQQQMITIQGHAYTTAELNTILPNYDGKWSIPINVAAGSTEVKLWDGDFDFGIDPMPQRNQANQVIADPTSATVSKLDTDDADTPNSLVPNVTPPFTIPVAGTKPEGAKGAGAPAENLRFFLFRRLTATNAAPGDGKPYPGVIYRLCPPGETGFSPSGDANPNCFYNLNPSGTEEWEQFRIAQNGDPDPADYNVPVIQDGLWTLEIEGLDAGNTVTLRTFNTLVVGTCVESNNCGFGASQAAVGNQVFRDTNGNGVFDAGIDDGINGVEVGLYTPGGVLIATTTTAFDGIQDGRYLFENLFDGNYRVEVTDDGEAYIASLDLIKVLGSSPSMDHHSKDEPYTALIVGGTDDLTADFGYKDVQEPCVFLVMDQDAVDNGPAPNFFSLTDVNDDVAEIGIRAQLRYFASHIGQTINLYSGDVGDEGWFAIKTIPASWGPAGGLAGFIGDSSFLPTQPAPHGVGPGLGAPDGGGDRESLLDKIPNVTPLRATGLKNLEGKCVCAVVFDSHVNINYGPLNGSLKGANLGTIAFKVLSVTKRTDGGSKALPVVQIMIMDSRLACTSIQLMTDADAPAPIDSSLPVDIDP